MSWITFSAQNLFGGRGNRGRRPQGDGTGGRSVVYTIVLVVVDDHDDQDDDDDDGTGGRSVVYTIIVVDDDDGGDVNEDGVVDEEKDNNVGGSIL